MAVKGPKHVTVWRLEARKARLVGAEEVGTATVCVAVAKRKTPGAGPSNDVRPTWELWSLSERGPRPICLLFPAATWKKAALLPLPEEPWYTQHRWAPALDSRQMGIRKF